MSAIREVIERHDYHEVLSVLSWVLSFKTDQQKQEYLVDMYEDFITADYDLPLAADGSVLFVRSLARGDYAQLFGSISGACEHPNKVFLNTFAKRKVSRNDSAIKFMTDHMDLMDRIRVRSYIDRQCAFILLMSYGLILEQYAKVKFDAVVCFSDMQPVENLFARYFKSVGVPTVTCQHGLYIDYSEFKTINYVNYMNQPSEYYLAWGEDTASLIKSYHADAKIVLCGKPVFHQGKAEAAGRSGKVALVILDQNIFNSQNIEMVKIAKAAAKSSGHKVCVRYHPSISRVNFAKNFETLEVSDDIMGADIVIGHTSSLLFEALALGKRVLQYKTSIPTVDLPEKLQFNSLTAFISAMKAEVSPSLGVRYFSCIEGKSRAAYRSFFNQLFDKAGGGPVTADKLPKRTVKRHLWCAALKSEFFYDPSVSMPKVIKAHANTISPVDVSKSLSSVVLPCLVSDVSNLKETLDHWCHPSFAPSRNGKKVKLIIVFNTINEVVKTEVSKAWQDRPRLALFFSELIVRSADLSGDRDLYVKERTRELKGTFGNIAGPNFLFFRAMEHAAPYGGFAFQMELDCVPLTDGWLDDLDAVVERSHGAWVIGAMYNGNFPISVVARTHLNGNALYNVGNAKFIEFLRDKWMSRLLELSKENPNLAYDCWWSFETHFTDTKDNTRASPWNLIRSYASFFHNEPFILNYIKSDPLRALFAEHYRFYESVGKRPLFLHHADAASLSKQVVAGEAASLKELLMPAMGNEI